MLIIIPTKGTGRSRSLEAAVESVASQTLAPRILIITPIASLDAVTAIAKPFGAVVLNQHREGLSAAINEAWERDAWRSHYTGWLGDDDLLLPSALERAVEVLDSDPRASMVHGRCRVVDDSGRYQFTIRNDAFGSWLAGWGMNLLAQPGSIYRTSAVRNVGGLDESLRYAMDVDLHLRLKRVGRIRHVAADVAVFCMHEGGLSTANASAAADEARLVRAEYQRGCRFARAREAASRVAAQAVWTIRRRPPAHPRTFSTPGAPDDGA